MNYKEFFNDNGLKQKILLKFADANVDSSSLTNDPVIRDFFSVQNYTSLRTKIEHEFPKLLLLDDTLIQYMILCIVIHTLPSTLTELNRLFLNYITSILTNLKNTPLKPDEFRDKARRILTSNSEMDVDMIFKTTDVGYFFSTSNAYQFIRNVQSHSNVIINLDTVLHYFVVTIQSFPISTLETLNKNAMMLILRDINNDRLSSDDPIKYKASAILMKRFDPHILNHIKTNNVISNFFTTPNAATIRQQVHDMYKVNLSDNIILEYMLLTYMTYPPTLTLEHMNKNLMSFIQRDFQDAIAFERKYQSDLKKIEDTKFLEVDKIPPAEIISHKQQLEYSSRLLL
jgi:hypothetical protein